MLNNIKFDTTSFIAIIRQRKVVFVSLLAGTLLANGYFFFTTPVYESRGLIEIGQIGQIGQTGQTGQVIQLENPTSIVVRWKEQWRLDDKTSIDKFPKLSLVEISRGNPPNHINIRSLAHSTVDAKNLLDQIGSQLIEQHKDKYLTTQDNQKKLLERYKTLALDIDKLEVIESAAMTDYSRSASRISLAGIIAAGELHSSSIYTFPTRWVQAPYSPDKPVTPKLSVAIIIGIFGMATALVSTVIIEKMARK